MIVTHTDSQKPCSELERASSKSCYFESLTASSLKNFLLRLQQKVSLAGTLEETQGRYASQLAGLQNSVTSLEAQLSQLHANITSNKQDYDVLLDLKARLEMEIAEYRRLLDGEDER